MRTWGCRLGSLGLTVLLLGGCREDPPPIEEPEDYTRAPVAPEGCTLSPLELGCTDGAGEIPTALGGASGLGGSGPVGEASCILRSAAQLSCPSLLSRLAMGRGSAGELDVAVGQKGLDGQTESGSTYADERLHLSTYRLEPGSASAEAQSFDPIDDGQRVTLAVVPGNEEWESLLAVHRTTEHPEPELSFSDVFSGGAREFTLAAGAQGFPPSAAIGPVGDGAFVELVPSAAELVEGLPSDPRRSPLGEALAVAVDYDEAGEPFVLLHQESELRLLGGMNHDELLWSMARGDSSSARVDLLVGGNGVSERRYMLVEDGQTTYPHLRVQEGSELPAQGSLARGTRGCDGWTLNVDCSECPVGTACENTDFITRGARLFAFGERVLVAVHWVEQVDSRVTDTDTSILGICVCDSTLLDTSNRAEYLSIYDVGYRGPETALELTLVLEQQIGDGDDVGSFGFARDAEDGLDFWYGSYLTQPESGLSAFPDGGRRFIIEHFGGAVTSEP